MTDSPTPTLFFALIHTANALQERLEASFVEIGLSAARFRLLDALTKHEGAMALGDLAASQSCGRSNVTQLVDRLEVEGWVRRVADPHDRRSVRAEITALGRNRHAAGAVVLAGALGDFERALALEDREALRRTLSALDAGTTMVHS